MERQNSQPRWGWLFVAIVGFLAMMVIRSAFGNAWLRLAAAALAVFFVGLCFLLSNLPR